MSTGHSAGMADDGRRISLEKALDFLKGDRPLRTEEVCRDYLVEHPGCTDHLRLLGHALIKQGRAAEAEQQLRLALSIDPEFPQLYEDLGSALALQSKFDEAIPNFERALELQPALPLVERKLGQALVAAGRGDEASEVLRDYVDKDPNRAAVFKGIELHRAGKPDEAMAVFRDVLKCDTQNVNAMRQLAVVYWRSEKRSDDAEAMLRQATGIADDFLGGWLTLSALLMDMGKYVDAIATYKKATQLDPDNAEAWSGLGHANGRAMYPEEATKAFERALEINDSEPSVLSSYAWELKTIGDQEGALKAYRRAVELKPSFGAAYWSMANLKIFKFKDAEIDEMLRQVERDDLTEVEDIHFRYALGKAMEDKKDYDRAWHFYHTGAQRQRMTVEHEPMEFERRQQAIRDVFTRELLEARSGAGFDAPDPIFIVGMPRSGSTLVEQILASHSQVEGTAELPIIGRITESIGRYRADGVRYPEAVRELRDKDLRGYGRQYIKEARRYRSTDKPLFTDKLPNNFPTLGFARLILPNAKFINARRHPFDTCLGNYKQLFGRGQNFTYDMLDLAHYYQQYVATMQHWHDVMPGQVLDVHYEETVTDLEGQVRRILDHCGLPFEESCLRYYETDRAVKTASSEQVRQPIYTSALGKWRRYDKHLDVWKKQLGDIVEQLPEASRNAGL
ncbi:MAG: sulfotransferase [Gammaproteobacteria bacterium]|nr:sulfotransferase [Gammaproteobacteria bacterium]